ncbi:hypothetical protein NL108_008855, partial [Boleophthalmus pectinirostris]
DVKFRSGEWFLEERSKKFPATGKNESVGERLLRTYGVLSHIAIVPPTPPPHLDCAFLSKSGLFKVPSLPNVFKRSRESDPESWSTGAEDTTSFTSGSCGSVSTDCGPMDALSAVGELELAVAYDNTTSCLEITVGACRNLMCGDSKKKKSNVYVQVYIRPGKHAKLKTTVKKSSTNPVYREVLKHHIEHSMLFGKHLQACVFNAGSLRRKAFLGEVLIPLDGWASSRSIEGFQWYPLCTK